MALGIGISTAAAELWKKYDKTSYDEALIEEGTDYCFFDELPDWAYSSTEGPFYINDDGAIYSISTRPSQGGNLIGNLTS